MTDKPPAGWYPDSEGTMRWWDGSDWTETLQSSHVSTATMPVPPAEQPRNARAELKAAKAYAKANRPWYKKKRWIGAIIILVIIVMVSLGSGGGDDPQASDSSSSAADTKDEPKAAPKPAPAPEEPDLTAAQENAVEAAENYIDLTPFSKKGLIKQLKFEDYTAKDATFAVNYIKPDYNKQAARAAEAYLDLSSFSRGGLITQLKFEGYTQEQAEYGVSKAGL